MSIDLRPGQPLPGRQKRPALNGADGRADTRKPPHSHQTRVESYFCAIAIFRYWTDHIIEFARTNHLIRARFGAKEMPLPQKS